MHGNHQPDRRTARELLCDSGPTLVLTAVVGLVVLSAVATSGALAAPSGPSTSLQTDGGGDDNGNGNGNDGDDSLCGIKELPDRWDVCDAVGERVAQTANVAGSLAGGVVQGITQFIYGLNGIFAVIVFRAYRQLSYSTFSTPYPEGALALSQPSNAPWMEVYATVAPPDGPHFLVGLLILILGVYGRHTLRVFGLTGASKSRRTHNTALRGVAVLILGFWGLSVLFMLTDVLTHFLMPDITAMTEAIGEQLPSPQEMTSEELSTRALFNPFVTVFFYIWGIVGYASLELLFWLRKTLLYVVVWAYPIGVGFAYSGLPVIEDYARAALKQVIPLTLLPVGGALVMRAFAFVVHNEAILAGRPSITLLLYLSFPSAVAFLSYKWFKMSSSVLAEGVERAKATPKKAVSAPMKYGKKAWRVGRRHRRRRRRERRHQERLDAMGGRSWSNGDTEQSFKSVNYQIHGPGGNRNGARTTGSRSDRGTIRVDARQPGEGGPTVDTGATAAGSPQGADPSVVGDGEPTPRAAGGASVSGALDHAGAGNADASSGSNPDSRSSGSTSPTPQQAPGTVSGAARTSGAADYEVPRGGSWSRSRPRSPPESQFLPRHEDFEWLDADDEQFRERLAQRATQFENSPTQQD